MKKIIFDMDGVIVDSESHWHKLEHSFFKKIIPNWQAAWHEKILGLKLSDSYETLKEYLTAPLTYQQFLAEFKGMAEIVYSQKAALIPGIKDLLYQLSQKNVIIALASSSPGTSIETVLNRFEISHYFSAVVSAEEIAGMGKPWPDVFLHTAMLLKVEPENCVVIEDSKNGVLAAKRAGMFCVGFRNGFNSKQDLSMADMEIEGFKGGEILALFE
ncbi:HAD family hydrolase [Candidatus Riflebacteria bacterium]